ncbi:hypothetical protein HK104_003867 [Borealophlyctis nickersoniae]|nr:hypothetical protein HK104_003867 [Borealophlyctis nickersoniae]
MFARNFARAAGSCRASAASSGARRFARAARTPSFFASAYGARPAPAAAAAPPASALAAAVRPFGSTSAAAGAANLGGVLEAGDSEFETILEEAADTPVIVDFYADWCGPCRTLGPVLERAVKENGKTFLVKVNTDEAQETAGKYGISALPTVMVFKNGKKVNSFVGSRDPASVKKFISEATA